ncbi:WecB/TagA/CpsF family glycosyltransferase [Thiomonas bhubaneswarensis]|uniref:Bacterial polymer biosynthesis proteins, WecB/TagA/CpsF family n=1 Tax=Thiomonas bhubaneswarensis TaxID=339866 RepID=A0A0K6I9X2_9BURK|nr:WecB/TagA/CpsF family glycosyltransferase [Thiomonas bhubaneswarensis]CUB00087.1 bacterial polymer biosynthesis proteins, WecB/TagA/CpsF family [Thiomonas bhubaneswarensis]
MTPSAPTVHLFGLNFQTLPFDAAVRAIAAAAQRRERGLVITPNVDHIVTVQQRPEVRQIYRGARFLFADGMPLIWASRLIRGKALPGRVTGADLLPALCAQAEAMGLSVAFVGGMPGIAARAAEVMRARHPALRVVAVHCPPFGFEADAAQTQEIIELCRATRPDLLFFGVGAPKQEIWSHAHLDQLDVGMVLCIGAALDFAAGTLQRAPQWMQRSGLEWLWRMAQDPRRLIRRYLLRDTAFVAIALREIVGGLFTRAPRTP